MMLQFQLIQPWEQMALIKYLQRQAKHSSVLLLFPVVLYIFLTQAALGQEGAIPDVCKHLVPPVNGLNYENELHRRWYISWWDGKCDGLSPWPLCQSRPYWETIAEPVLKQYSIQTLIERPSLGSCAPWVRLLDTSLPAITIGAALTAMT